MIVVILGGERLLANHSAPHGPHATTAQPSGARSPEKPPLPTSTGSGTTCLASSAQLDETLAFLSGISGERSLYRYAPDKWSLRELLGHLNDAERLFVFRALWFARGLDSPLPSFEEKEAVVAAAADQVPWARHLEEFRAVRLATLAFFRNLPAEAWTRRGIASGNPFTVRALAFIAAGHVVHHTTVIRGSTLGPRTQANAGAGFGNAPSPGRQDASWTSSTSIRQSQGRSGCGCSDSSETSATPIASSGSGLRGHGGRARSSRPSQANG
jgi:hypothetical protein